MGRGWVGPPEDWRSVDPVVARWVASEALVSPLLWTDTADLWVAWQSWALDEIENPGTLNAFGRALTRLGFPAVKGPKGVRRRSGLALSRNPPPMAYSA